MILDRLQTANVLFGRLEAAQTIENQIATLDPVSERVTSWSSDFRLVASQFALFRRKGLIDPEDVPQIEKMRATLAKVRQHLADSPLEITSGNDYTTLTRQADNLLKKLQELLERKWNDWLSDNVTKVTESEIAPYSKWPEYRDTVRDIDTKNSQLRRQRNQLPETMGDFTEIETLSDELARLLNSLPSKAPTEVKAFLDAANSRDGATLDQFTPEVRAWLEENDQLDNFRIKR